LPKASHGLHTLNNWLMPCCRANRLRGPPPQRSSCRHPFAFAHSPANYLTSSVPGKATLGYFWRAAWYYASGGDSFKVEVWCTASSVSLVVTPVGDQRGGWYSGVFTLESSAFEGLTIKETVDTFMDVSSGDQNNGAVGTLSGSTLTISMPATYGMPADQVNVVATYTLVRLPSCTAPGALTPISLLCALALLSVWTRPGYTEGSAVHPSALCPAQACHAYSNDLHSAWQVMQCSSLLATGSPSATYI